MTMDDPLSYVAPSWSWAAHDFYVEFNTPKKYTDPLAECSIEEVLLETDRGHPFGQVRGGMLKILGKLIPFPKFEFWDTSRRDLVRIFSDNRVPIAEIWLDCKIEISEAGKLSLLPVFLEAQVDENAVQFQPGNNGIPSEFSCRRGLILCSTNTAGCFYRVGIFHSLAPEESSNFWEILSISKAQSITLI